MMSNLQSTFRLQLIERIEALKVEFVDTCNMLEFVKSNFRLGLSDQKQVKTLERNKELVARQIREVEIMLGGNHGNG